MSSDDWLSGLSSDELYDLGCQGIITSNQARGASGLKPYDLGWTTPQPSYPVYTPLRGKYTATPIVDFPVWKQESYGTADCQCGEPCIGAVLGGCLNMHIFESWMCGRCLSGWENPQKSVKWCCPECGQSIEEFRTMRT
jgi:hypothetical protein